MVKELTRKSSAQHYSNATYSRKLQSINVFHRPDKAILFWMVKASQIIFLFSENVLESMLKYIYVKQNEKPRPIHYSLGLLSTVGQVLFQNT